MAESSSAHWPVGKHRNVPVCILLEIVTVGVYGCYWVWRTQEDVKRRNGQGAGGWLGLLIYLVTWPVAIFLIPYEIKQMHEAEDEKSPVKGATGLWNLIPLIGQIVWFVKIQGALNRFWASRKTSVSGWEAIDKRIVSGSSSAPGSRQEPSSESPADQRDALSPEGIAANNLATRSRGLQEAESKSTTQWDGQQRDQLTREVSRPPPTPPTEREIRTAAVGTKRCRFCGSVDRLVLAQTHRFSQVPMDHQYVCRRCSLERRI